MKTVLIGQCTCDIRSLSLHGVYTKLYRKSRMRAWHWGMNRDNKVVWNKWVVCHIKGNMWKCVTLRKAENVYEGWDWNYKLRESSEKDKIWDYEIRPEQVTVGLGALLKKSLDFIFYRWYKSQETFSPCSKEGNSKFMWEYIGRGQNWIQGMTTVDIRALEVRMVKRIRNWDRFPKLIKFGMICQT